MIDPAHLAGELHNAIACAYRFTSMHVIYRGGGWTLRIRRLGGMIRGDIVVRFRPDVGEILVERCRLWGSNSLATIPLARIDSAKALAGEIASLTALRPR